VVAVKPSRLSAALWTTSGRPVRARLRNGWLRSRAAAARLLARVVGADHDPGDRGGEDRVGARRLAALVGAGLEREVQRRSGRIAAAAAAVGERRDLGVQLAERLMAALADRLAVAHDHRPDERIRAHPSPPSLRQLQRPPKVIPIAICQ